MSIVGENRPDPSEKAEDKAVEFAWRCAHKLGVLNVSDDALSYGLVPGVKVLKSPHARQVERGWQADYPGFNLMVVGPSEIDRLALGKDAEKHTIKGGAVQAVAVQADRINAALAFPVTVSDEESVQLDYLSAAITDSRENLTSQLRNESLGLNFLLVHVLKHTVGQMAVLGLQRHSEITSYLETPSEVIDNKAREYGTTAVAGVAAIFARPAVPVS
jgi:hypothetical protein